MIEVAAGLVFRGGKLLITQRYADAHQGGLWEFPGGKRDPQETFEACLARELREELGIEVEVRELLEEILHEYPERAVLLRFFRCVWRKNEPQPLGCPDFRWVSLEEMSAFEFPAADARLLETLRRRADLWR
jgi:mutator protein MutT